MDVSFSIGVRPLTKTGDSNDYEKIGVYDLNEKDVACYNALKQISGYKYEVIACIR